MADKKKFVIPKEARETVCPLLAALFWGVSFVVLKKNTMPIMALNATRFFVAFLFLLAVCLILEKGRIRQALCEKTRKETGKLWFGGFLCGLCLAGASYLQQLGMTLGTEAGKAGFLTALYVVLVPVFGIVIKKKAGWNVWLAVLVAVFGLYLLCVPESGFTIQSSDLLVISSAVIFAMHIMLTNHYSSRVHVMKLTALQSLFCAVISALCSLMMEDFGFASATENLLPILYLGVVSCGLAYLMQNISLINTNAAKVSLFLCMESVFSVLADMVFLKTKLSAREYIGCGIMFLAVLLTEVVSTKKERKKMRRRKSDKLTLKDV